MENIFYQYKHLKVGSFWKTWLIGNEIMMKSSKTIVLGQNVHIWTTYYISIEPLMNILNWHQIYQINDEWIDSQLVVVLLLN